MPVEKILDRSTPTAAVPWAAAFVAAYVGLGIAILHPALWEVPPGYFVYPPSGFALAFLAVRGRRFWPAVGLGAAVVTAVVDRSALHALMTGVGSGIEVLIAVRVLEARGGFPGRFSVRSVVSLLMAGAAGAAFSAAFGAAGMVLALGLPLERAPGVFGMWTLGHGLGLIVVGGSLMLLLAGALRRKGRLLEPAVVFALIVVTSQLAFGHWGGPTDEWPVVYVTYPLLAWAALRHSQTWVAAGGLTVAVSAMVWTGLGAGPLYRGDMESSLLYVSVLTSSLCVGQLFLSAMVKERDEAEARLESLLGVLPVATAVLRRDDDAVLFLNDTWKRVVGPEEPRTFGEAAFWRDPGTWDRLKHELARSATGVLDKRELPFLAAEGHPGVCEVSLVRHDAEPAAIIFAMDDVTRRAEVEREMTYLAFHDPLTGLANRTQFRARFSAATQCWHDEGTPFAVVVIDLEGFKDVNDSFGHDAGDQVLVRVGARLRSSVREADLVVRVGGDEFILLLEGCLGGAEAHAIAEAALERISHPIRLDDDVTVNVAASMGVAHSGDHPERVGDLVKIADRALYDGRAERARPAPTG